jgi:protein-tyrosine phosphatase
MFNKIIVVCTGNICRSPIGEQLLRERLSGAQVLSGGVAALVGRPADPLAQQVMQENGHDISGHRAQQLTSALLTQMDLILAMDQSHVDWIRVRLPQLQGRVFKFGRWSGNVDVADPFRQPKAAFDQAYSEIRLYTEQWLERIGVK